jgi:hypothetical protein
MHEVRVTKQIIGFADQESVSMPMNDSIAMALKCRSVSSDVRGTGKRV